MWDTVGSEQSRPFPITQSVRCATTVNFLADGVAESYFCRLTLIADFLIDAMCCAPGNTGLCSWTANTDKNARKTRRRSILKWVEMPGNMIALWLMYGFSPDLGEEIRSKHASCLKFSALIYYINIRATVFLEVNLRIDLFVLFAVALFARYLKV